MYPTHPGPPLLSGGQLVKVAEGDKVGVDIEGAPEAYPTPSFYQWSRQGEDVMSDSRVNFSYADVLFSSVQRMDSGVYTLTATNHRLDNETAAIGTGLGNFTLDVLCECACGQCVYDLSPFHRRSGHHSRGCGLLGA